MKTLRFEIEDNIGILTLSNPKLNLVSSEFFEELEELQRQIFIDKTLNGLVILADGPNFSAGIDISYLNKASSRFMKDNLVRLQDLYSFWQKLPIPVIAGIQGYCIGSAVELILGCDLRVSGHTAKYSLPEVKLGLSPDMGGTARLTKLLGTGQAKRLIMLCEEIDADEALRIGLVEKKVNDKDLKNTVLNMAKTMANFPPSAIRFSKKVINGAADASLSTSLLMEEIQSTYCSGTEDFREATISFVEKRKAEFKDR
ncbi:enoyl-CoA hydratase/isomerase family protein [Tissierella praeacuta]|uniref:enoyl-CoA hydratase/isomerase family protein n=1 Tax=Tissierella praeacuta TaxID=43131 RepID=UPI003515CC34